MNTLINPMFFYLISILDKLNILLTVIMSLAIIVIFIAGFSLLFDEDLVKTKGNKLKLFKVSIAITIISTVLMIITPNDKTLTKMLIASKVTTENIDKVKNTIKDSVDYIIDKMNESKEGK